MRMRIGICCRGVRVGVIAHVIDTAVIGMA